jgi:hypothetical protein
LFCRPRIARPQLAHAALVDPVSIVLALVSPLLLCGWRINFAWRRPVSRKNSGIAGIAMIAGSGAGFLPWMRSPATI